MRHSTVRRGVLAVLVLALSVSGATRGEPTRRDRIDEQLTVISKFAINARAKLSNGVIGRPSEGSATRSGGAAQICCSTNVERMHRGVSELRGIIGELEGCYIDTAHEGAMAMTAVFSADVSSFSRAVDGFADSGSPGDALGRLAALTRLYVIMSDSAKAVEDCPAVEADAKSGAGQPDDSDIEDGEDKKKKKKRSKKKDGSSDGSR